MSHLNVPVENKKAKMFTASELFIFGRTGDSITALILKHISIDMVFCLKKKI